MKTSDVTTAWREVRCASLRVDDLRVLAEVRGRADLRVVVDGDRAWVRWQADSAMITEVLVGRILPIEGVELFVERGGRWYRLGEHLPAFFVPFRNHEDGVPLDRLLIPEKLSAQRPERGLANRLDVGVAPDQRGEARPATAMRCELVTLAVWAEQATSYQLSRLQGTWRKASDGEDGKADAFVRGGVGTLPLLPESVRYWGTDLLVPLGFRVDPALPEGAIRRVVGADEGDLVVFDEQGFELIARDTFKPLSRAGIRLARGYLSGNRPGEGSVR